MHSVGDSSAEPGGKKCKIPVIISLVPRPPPFFCSSVCVQYNTRMLKSDEKRGRPGNTYHVNDVRWTQGGHGGGSAHLQTCVQ